jgi:CubicO group peptidase (beta-lactamase class C family)
MRRRSTRLVSRALDALRQVDQWGAANVAAGVAGPEGVRAVHGPTAHEFRWASVTKLATALATLVAAEEGVVDLDEPAGPPGATVRHLLAHASGLPFEGATPIAEPGKRRIYSNTGFEQLAAHVEAAAEMPFAEYLREAVFRPLEMHAELRGSAGADVHGTLEDALKLAAELIRPTLIAPETLDEAATVQFPGLDGVIPGLGRYEPNDWGLGLELRDGKTPHWTGTRNSPRTFGHFGGSGTFLWVDPEFDLACVALSDREFDDWALEAWPRLSDAVLGELLSSASAS